MSGTEDRRVAFAEECRAAGLAFMRGVAGGWSRRELAQWLVGTYGRVAVKAPAKSSPPAPESGVRSEALSDVLREARWKAFAALEEAAAGHARFVQDAAGKGLLVRDSERGWVPVDRPGARLRARVLSLFAVDCLLRPADYRNLLLACPRCESVVFDAAARDAGRCCGRKPATDGGSGPRPRVSDYRRSIPAPELVAAAKADARKSRR